jgi:hypothetical protein
MCPDVQAPSLFSSPSPFLLFFAVLHSFTSLSKIPTPTGKWINEGGVDGGTKGEIGNVGTTSDRVRGDGISNDGTEVVTESKADEMINRIEGRTDGRADNSRFQSSIVETAGDMTKSGDQFSGAVEERVFKEEVGKEIETTSFQIGHSMDSWGGRNEKFNGIRGATKREGDESRARDSK